MKIGLYNPYLSTVFGGGERHFLSIASCLANKHQVDVVMSHQPDPKLRLKLNRMFNLDISKVNFTKGPFDVDSSARDRSKFSKDYDIFYYMTDGSFFISKAKKTIVHFQVPFPFKPKFIQKLKLKTAHTITTNSEFTKQWLESKWRIKIDYVHRGSIDTLRLKSGLKKNIIISVGRFTSGLHGKHCKRQDFLVRTFKKMVDQGLRGWRLVLHGPIEEGIDNQKFAKKVALLSQKYPITIKHNSSFKNLSKDYAQAKIYWHAAGYGKDQTKDPQAVEHLGLTTAEAQASGAVPVVINKGGQPEVVESALNGLLWNNQKELIKQTKELINDPSLLNKLSANAIKASKQFSQKKFCHLTNKIFKL